MAQTRKSLEKRLERDGVIRCDLTARPYGVLMVTCAVVIVGGWMAVAPLSSPRPGVWQGTVMVWMIGAALAAGGLYLALRTDQLCLDLPKRTYQCKRGFAPALAERHGTFEEFSHVSLRLEIGGSQPFWRISVVRKDGLPAHPVCDIRGYTDTLARSEVQSLAGRLAAKLGVPLRDEAQPRDPELPSDAPLTERFAPLETIQGKALVWVRTACEYELRDGARPVSLVTLTQEDSYLKRGIGLCAAGEWLLERRISGMMETEYRARRRDAREEFATLKAGASREGPIELKEGRGFLLVNPDRLSTRQVVRDAEGHDVLLLRRHSLGSAAPEVTLLDATLPEAGLLLVLTAFVALSTDNR
jgi:hypothetical protein